MGSISAANATRVARRRWPLVGQLVHGLGAGVLGEPGQRGDAPARDR
jgi:hypothetical protein